ncbi:uncharacterized protein LOC132549520 [Ylistrum balloti]|uniref:uncharacterized protein LOC132549520 n=1 Tax=Ylistrum balloti TaxID=509963 RepID=UPI002905E7F9|nr:uncharacterized protein LOC132549520 [Ylistrum balloti]
METSPDPLPIGPVGPATSDTDHSPNPANNNTTVSVANYSKDQIDPAAKPGQCGIYNLGNTCFMNAGLHCLMNTAPIIKYFLDQYSCDTKFGQSLAAHFYWLACKYWSGSYAIIHPGDFKTCLGTFHNQFEDYRQHDCQEFLALMLDTLHEETNKSNVIFMERQGSLPSTDTPKCEQDQLNNSLEYITPSANELTATTGKNDQLNNSLDQITVAELTSMPSNDQLNNSLEQSVSSEQLNNSLERKCVDGGENLSGCEAPTNRIGERITQQQQVVEQLSPLVDGDASSKNDFIFAGQQNMDMSTLRPLLNNSTEFKQTLPSLHQFYAKESKTLNTNVLLDKESGGESLNTDSQKFAKQDNDSPLRLNEVNLLQDMAPMEVDKNDHPKGLKDVNIQADKCQKASIGIALCFAEQKSMTAQTTMKNADSESMCFDPDVDSVKRMKFESTEKNFQHQAFSKLNKNMSDTKGSCSVALQDFKNRYDSIADSPKSTDTDAKLEDEVESNSILGLSESVGAQQLEEDEDEEDDDEDEEDVLCDAADQAWDSYIKRHNSIVVSTFQGMFKSTVICSDCNHVSVTFEPFMYLSIPLPHSMERQLCVWVMPISGSPTKYLLTLHKNDKIQTVKQQLKAYTGDQDLVMAEVLEGHIAKTLDDNVALRFVNDSTRLVFAYQMPSPPKNSELSEASKDSADIFSKMDTFVPGVTQLEDNSLNAVICTQDHICNQESRSKDDNSGKNNIEVMQNLTAESTVISNVVSGQEDCDPSLSLTVEMTMENTADQPQLRTDLSLMDDAPYMLDAGSSEIQSDNPLWGDEKDPAANWSYHPTSPENPVTSETFPTSTTHESIETWISDNMPATDGSGSTVAPSVVTPDQWRSCAICLEDLMDIELMVHQQCGGTFCQTCLEMSVRHYGEDSYTCPVCSAPAVLTEDFTSLGADNSDQPVKIRVISVPVSFNICTENGDRRLIGHPRPLYLANTMSGQELYDYIDEICPVRVDYTLTVTDGQGLHCSRCDYTSKCQGCLLTREEDVLFRPGDNLAVCYGELTAEQLACAETYHTDKSMELRRPDKPLHINDCLEAFTESEVLDEHNPWFCPRCERNQCAKKTMTVWQYPDRLIIHLKRFMFHELSSTKVDNNVVFPLEGLDLTQMISGPNTKCPLYDLYGIVCHFGGANAGHYTAYAQHPQDRVWYYYNDETISQQEPNASDFSNAYILFYQRQGTEVQFDFQEFLTRHKIEGLMVPDVTTDSVIKGSLSQSNNGPNTSQGSCDRNQSGDIAVAS